MSSLSSTPGSATIAGLYSSPVLFCSTKNNLLTVGVHTKRKKNVRMAATFTDAVNSFTNKALESTMLFLRNLPKKPHSTGN